MCNYEIVYSQESQGTLIFRVLNYTTEVKIPKNIKSQIDFAGVNWSVIDSTLIITLLNTKFLRPEIKNRTKYRDEKILTLNTGKYSIDCISYQLMTDFFSKDINKALSSTAFFNLDIVSFYILKNDTTIVEILTEYAKYTISGKDIYNPILTCRVKEDENIIEKRISLRTNKSISWDEYKGPFKL